MGKPEETAMQTSISLAAAAGGGLLLVALGCWPAHAAECVEDRRTVTFADGQTTKLRSYRCDVAGGSLNVEFHRMSDAFASAILDGSVLESITPVFSDFTVVDTPVRHQFKRLLDAGSFVQEVGAYGAIVAVTAPGQETHQATPGDGQSSMRVRKVSWSGKIIDLPAPIADVRSIIDGKLPKGVNLYSQMLDRYDPSSLSFWRDLKTQDLSDYASNLDRYVEFFRFPSDYRSNYSTPPESLVDFGRALGGRFPPGLAALTTFQNGSGCSDWSGILSEQLVEQSYFSYVQLPEVLVDAVLIQNSTAREIAIGSLLGEFDSNDVARPFVASDRSKMEGLGFGSLKIGAGSSVVIPLGILLVSGGADSARELGASEKAMATRYARAYDVDVSRYREHVRKRFSFGSKLTVNGLDVAGQQLALAGRSANYTALMIDLEGSCPYLSTWDASDGWVEHGKILHRASAPELEEQEVYSGEGFVARIRLDEREPERAVIRSVEAVLHLEDGTVPALVAATGYDGRIGEFALNWGDRVELQVVLPDGVEAADVQRTDIVLQGYYERYTAIASAIVERDPGNGIPATSIYRRNQQCAMPLR
jgi:hypothetical protein